MRDPGNEVVGNDAGIINTLFSLLNIAINKFRNFENTAKFNTREI